ncbi:MAG: hypothetical protein PHQ74_04915 [Crocinitomicaceae bacterium]|nr:hypothetical protein [Crocinitomicaceae bacterium]
MKQLFILAITAFGFGTFAQSQIVTSEQSIPYSVGSKNSIVVTVPYGKADVVAKQLKSEMKDWGGKLKTSKTESTTLQSSVKSMFERKTFDSYVKIITVDNEVKVAVAVDLGGAFMTSSQHPTQYGEMKERMEKFAMTAAKASVNDNVKAEQKALSTLEKEEKTLEKTKEKHLKDIESYKKKISESQKQIEDNIVLQTKKKEEVKTQKAKINDLENLKFK